MLTQGPAPDPKCKLNISLLLTLPHPSDCLICANGIMIVVSLLQIMGDGKVRGSGGWFIYVRVWVEGQGMVSLFLLFCFCVVINCSFMAGT